MPGQPTAHQIAFLRRLEESLGPISYGAAFELATATFPGHACLERDVWLPRDHRLWLAALAACGWIDLVADGNTPDMAVEITERGRSLMAGREPAGPGALGGNR